MLVMTNTLLYNYSIIIQLITEGKIMQRLTEVKAGKKVIIKQISGGFGIKNRFESLNIREGKEIQVVASGPFRGPLILNIDGCKLAVGRGMAAKISVEVVDENSSYGQS